MVGVVYGAGRNGDPAEPSALREVHSLADGGAEERAEHGGGRVVVGKEGAECLAEVGDDLLEALAALVGGDAGSGIRRFCGLVQSWPL